MNQMTTLGDLALLGWVPLTLILFHLLPVRRAVVLTTVVGWLFLPNASYDLPGLPDYGKTTATVLGAFLGAVVRSPASFMALRPTVWDIPAILLCLCPFPSALDNDLGVYEAMSSTLDQCFTWGTPYLVGRALFNDLESLQELAIGVMIGGLIYVPLCLWEIRMSPQLHFQLYGFRTRSFALAHRSGGFRPQVFMWTYLPVVLWLSLSTIICFQFWLNRSIRRLIGIPLILHLAALLGTLVLCKQFIGAILVPLAIGLFVAARTFRTKLPFLLILMCIPTAIGLRGSGAWSAQGLLELAMEINPERGESLRVRLVNEDAMAEKARERPMFGWGGFGRNRVYDDSGQSDTLTDGMWVIQLGTYGFVGLISIVGFFFLPLYRFHQRVSVSDWYSPRAGPAIALAVGALLTFLYNIPNSSHNPVISITLGGLVFLHAARLPTRSPQA